jgi:pyruvate/2-oxoglutarate dehydrogenase complex dihydrolipoamide acyltransferase (E2) component
LRPASPAIPPQPHTSLCRYLAKRALYLAHIASQLEAHPQLGTLTWACLADDPRRPALLLHPPPGTSPAGFCIRLLPAAPPELCPLPKLGPARNNLRSAVSVPAPPPPEVLAAAAAAAAAATKAAAVAAAAAKAARGGRRARPVRGPNPAKQLQERKAAAAAAAKAAEVAAAKAAAAAPPPPQEPKQLATPHYNTSVLQVGALLYCCIMSWLHSAQACMVQEVRTLHAQHRLHAVMGWGGQGRDTNAHCHY